MNTARSLKGWFLHHRKKIAEIGTGITLYAIFNWIFNYPLYMWVIATWGIVSGGLIMIFLSLIQCSLLLVMFDKMGIDWVGTNYVDYVVEKKEKTRAEKIIVWAVRKEHQTVIGKFTKFIGFCAMCIFVDPFLVAVHYRKKQFSGVTKRDWQILAGAVFIGNLYWILRTGILVSIGLKLWELIKTYWGY